MRMMTAEEERRMTLLEVQVGSQTKQIERYDDRVRKLREFIDENCSHSVHLSSCSQPSLPCRVCQFLDEDAL